MLENSIYFIASLESSGSFGEFQKCPTYFLEILISMTAKNENAESLCYT